MARRPGIFRRGPGLDGEERTESEAGPTPEQAAQEPHRVGRFMAWLGYAPESEPEPGESETGEPATEVQASADTEREPGPATSEWQVHEGGGEEPEVNR